MIRATIVLSLIVCTFAFGPASRGRQTTSLNVRSKSVPFLEQAPALDGKLAGDVGFDPLFITSLWSDVSFVYAID